MVNIDTFLTTLYVMVDDFCKEQLPPEKRPGPEASLSLSEVVTLAIFGQWARFQSQWDFYRYAHRHLQEAFPTLPDHSQFNRLLRGHLLAIIAFFRYLVTLLAARYCPYEALDSSGVPTRNSKRGGSRWLAGQANIGWCNKLGWYQGFHLLMAVNPQGVITRFAFGSASTADQYLAETSFALRHQPHPRLESVGWPALGPYVVDKGFEGKAHHQRWRFCYGAQVICPPKSNSHHYWPKRLRRWVAGVRQIVETVYGSFTTPSVWTGRGPMTWVAFGPAWPPKWPCIISTSDSMSCWVGHGWLLLICWTGSMICLTPSVLGQVAQGLLGRGLSSQGVIPLRCDCPEPY